MNDDLISRRETFESLIEKGQCSRRYRLGEIWELNGSEIREVIESLPSKQSEYKPVTAEDFAKIMSENTIYGFTVWHDTVLELIERQGFVICKKTM